MLVLYETTNGIAVFKTTDSADIDDQAKNLELVNFRKYKSLSSSFKENSKLSEGKISKTLIKTVRETIKSENEKKLAVYDKKICKKIQKKCKAVCVYGDSVNEIMREIKANLQKYAPKVTEGDGQYRLSLSHSISTKKIKFSPDKVDLMVIQAIALVDDIDKELNNYYMRIKEWYGWHFPELANIIAENEKYVKLVKKTGIRKKNLPDLSDLVDEETERNIKKAAIVSMGTDINSEDEDNIKILCGQYLEISDYRNSLQEYLKERMKAICPNLCSLVGELVGARLIAKAGSLLNLAKSAASTIQIFGAEKALFRSLKTKSNPPKYGLIYHAKVIGNSRKKGKAARILANKAAIATRYDAFSNPDKTKNDEFINNLTLKLNKELTKRC